MPRLEILAKGWKDLRWQVFWYGIGLALIAVLDVCVYPSYHSQLANFEMPEAFKALMGNVDYASPKGFLSAEFFSWVPALVVVFAIMAGTSALAGEEAAGTLDLLLSQPLSRSRLVLEKMAAIVLATGGLAALTVLGWLLSVPFISIDISLSALVVASLNLIPLILFFAALAMAAAAIMPDRRLATGFAAAIAVVGYFINYLANLVDLLKPFRYVSPFFYHDGANVLVQGLDPLKIIVIASATIVLSAAAMAAFRRRDLGVHRGLTLWWGRR